MMCTKVFGSIRYGVLIAIAALLLLPAFADDPDTSLVRKTGTITTLEQAQVDFPSFETDIQIIIENIQESLVRMDKPLFITPTWSPQDYRSYGPYRAPFSGHEDQIAEVS